MLKPAILYADLLQGLFIEAVFTDRFKFYSRNSGIDYFIPIYQNSGDMLQFVSVNNQGEVIGYFGAKINREIDAAQELAIVNFREINYTFSADLRDFFISLFEKFGVQKATWWAIVGNPAETLYDKVIKAHGGRIVGTFKNDAKLFDGKLYDVKWYEIQKENFCLIGNRQNGGVVDG
jgi:hypothetical protein